MNGGLLLEAELRRRATHHGDAATFWKCYERVKDYLPQEYYRWIQSNCPYYTDHGESHITSVIQAASSLLQKHPQPVVKDALSNLDLFLILSAILWHDVGMVCTRSGHASSIAQVVDKVKEMAFPDITVQRLVEEIVAAHPSGADLSRLRYEQDLSTAEQTYTIYPRDLAAIVRFADEISENRSRISLSVLPTVPADQQLFWEYASCISASRPDPIRERVVVSIEVEHEKAIREFTCKDFAAKANADGKMPLITYILYRLEKMNNEMAYCAPKFSRYVSIQHIAARFTLLRNNKRIDAYELSDISFEGSHSYPDIHIVDEFFESNPAWTVEALEEALER